MKLIKIIFFTVITLLISALLTSSVIYLKFSKEDCIDVAENYLLNLEKLYEYPNFESSMDAEYMLYSQSASTVSDELFSMFRLPTNNELENQMALHFTGLLAEESMQEVVGRDLEIIYPPEYCGVSYPTGNAVHEVSFLVKLKDRGYTSESMVKLKLVEADTKDKLMVYRIEVNPCGETTQQIYTACKQPITNADAIIQTGDYERAKAQLQKLQGCSPNMELQRIQLIKFCNTELAVIAQAQKDKQLKEQQIQQEIAKAKEEEKQKLEEELKKKQKLEEELVAQKVTAGDRLFQENQFKEAKSTYLEALKNTTNTDKINTKIIQCNNCIAAQKYVKQGDNALRQNYRTVALEQYVRANNQCKTPQLQNKVDNLTQLICSEYFQRANELFNVGSYEEAKYVIQKVYAYDTNYPGAKELERKCSNSLEPTFALSEIQRAKSLFINSKPKSSDKLAAYNILNNFRNSPQMDGDAHFYLAVMKYQPSKYKLPKLTGLSSRQINLAWKIYMKKALELCQIGRCSPAVQQQAKYLKDDAFIKDR